MTRVLKKSIQKKKDKRIPHELKPTERQQFGTFIQRVIRQLELSKNNPVRFNDIADCDKRRQSDLYNILNALDVFGYISDKLIIWKGFDATTSAFVRYGIQNEITSQKKGIIDIFRVGPSPSLSILVVKFICLFIYLGTDSLNIRDVVNLFSDSAEQAKKVLRRLYLVVFVLEHAGIIEHGNAYSLYTLKMPLDVIINTIFQETSRLSMFPDGSIESLLSRLDGVYVKNLHRRRMELFNQAAHRFEVIE